MTRFIQIAVGSAALWLLAQTPADAACVGLGCSCSISADPLDFGVYNPVGAGDVDAAGNVSVTCGALVLGANISYEVTLDPGGSGDVLNRTMTNGGDALAYNLFTNAARTIIWGDGAGGTGVIANAYLLTIIFARTDDFPIYGRLPAGQNANPGAYSDTIVATVIF